MKIFLQIIKTFSRNERLIFILAGLIFVVSFIFIAFNFFYQCTNLVPVSGGQYIEGLVGQPSFINPVLAGGNNPDGDLTELIFNNLLALSENYKTDESGCVWNVRLKEGLLWDDGQPITSDDVIFTLRVIQDPDSHSSLSSVWQEVSAERVSEREVKLTLPEIYVFFKSNLKNLKIIPKHIFASIPAANFRLSDFNLEPVGNGPFKFLSLKKEHSGFISEYQLIRNEKYSGQKPYLKKIILKFYQDEEELIKAFNSGTIDGFGGLDEKEISRIKISSQIFEVRMPRYYAVFFNPYSHGALEDKNVRLALNYATDREKLIREIFGGRAIPAEGPLVLGMNGYDAEVYPEETFSLDEAGEILEADGFEMNNEGIREKKVNKQTERLEFNLVVPDISFLVQTANLIKEDWIKIGVKLNLIIRSPQEINDEFIKTRNYQMILFGNIFENGDSPDLYSFWHSAERFYPGLNLSLYEDETVDALIELVRETLNDLKRQIGLSTLQSMIIQDYPAAFLFSPHYLYVAKGWLKGFNEVFISSTSQRFQNVEKWYVKTARVFK